MSSDTPSPVGYARKQDLLIYSPCWMTYAKKPAPENGHEAVSLYTQDQVDVMLAAKSVEVVQVREIARAEIEKMDAFALECNNIAVALRQRVEELEATLKIMRADLQTYMDMIAEAAADKQSWDFKARCRLMVARLHSILIGDIEAGVKRHG